MTSRSLIIIEEMIYEVAGIKVEVEEKRIKNFNLRVTATGEIKASVPRGAKEKTVEKFLKEHEAWIKKHFLQVSKNKDLRKLKFEEGENIPLLGKSYPLQIKEKTGRSKIVLKENKLELQIAPGSSRKKREDVFLRWWKQILQAELARITPYWEEQIGVSVRTWRIQKMTTLWGSCRTGNKSITINLDLIKKDVKLLEYIVVHELVHFLEGTHNQRFKDLMSRYLPDWQERHKELDGKKMR